MTVVRTQIYASANGDRWYLCRGENGEDVFVLHEPNGPSGGTPSRSDLTTFLASGHGAPERRALLRTIGALVDIDSARPPSSVQGPEPGAAGAEPTPGERASAQP
ncbi:hypothetical protein LNAOJCKE_4961 [Methylorubrum aminovorans]|uniref:Uncharacterized protein n=1 Tax=Methylorubrum aminovorans TaxID=269069 RepID=A0ABQ4UKP3_9HYPH|nr:hypothetical protein [Methylorubrum aminovorans]GJE67729.1 hypothetical protein LNAOJCKE_4961 [Methylorubrum aminovorans]